MVSMETDLEDRGWLEWKRIKSKEDGQNGNGLRGQKMARMETD